MLSFVLKICVSIPTFIPLSLISYCISFPIRRIKFTIHLFLFLNFRFQYRRTLIYFLLGLKFWKIFSSNHCLGGFILNLWQCNFPNNWSILVNREFSFLNQLWWFIIHLQWLLYLLLLCFWLILPLHRISELIRVFVSLFMRSQAIAIRFDS